MKSVLLTCFTLFCSFAFAQSFKGKIQAEYIQGETPTHVVWNIDGENFNMELSGEQNGKKFHSTIAPNTQSQTLTIHSENPSGASDYSLSFAQFQGLNAGKNKSFQVSTSSETAEIAGYQCQKYLIDAGKESMEVWVAKDLKVDKKLMAELLQDAPELQALTSKNIEGFPLKLRSNTRNYTTVSVQ